MTDSTRTSPPETAGHPDARTLRILVIPRPGRHPLFYYEPAPEDDEDDEDDAGAAGEPGSPSLRTRLRRLSKGVREAEHHAPQWLRSPIRWLKSKLPADERLLMALRNARRVELLHPPSMAPEQARSDWSAYLDRRSRSRAGQLAIYLVILAPSVLIAMLPGPNIIGFWVTFRIVAHSLALYGIIRARRGKIEVTCRPSDALEGPIATERREAERVQRHFHLLGLKGRLKRERVLSRLSHRRQRASAAGPMEESGT